MIKSMMIASAQKFEIVPFITQNSIQNAWKCDEIQEQAQTFYLLQTIHEMVPWISCNGHLKIEQIRAQMHFQNLLW